MGEVLLWVCLCGGGLRGLQFSEEQVKRDAYCRLRINKTVSPRIQLINLVNGGCLLVSVYKTAYVGLILYEC